MTFRNSEKGSGERGGIEALLAGIRLLFSNSLARAFLRVALQLSGSRDVAPTHFYVGGDPRGKSDN